MFIVCPSCSGPYRIPADQIAPLVQTACPHCEYRIILDFEAANDPSLRDAGQQFAQGFESVEAYASVYDHVTSKPGAQPRPGVTSVGSFASSSASGSNLSAQAEARPQQAAASAAQARPQRPETAAPATAASATSAAATASAASAASATSSAATAPVSSPEVTPAAASSGNRHKTVLQVPSKKPVSMDPRGESPSLSGATNQAAGASMRAGKGVDVVEPKVEEPKVESRTQPASEPSERKPPHTPPTTGVVSSGPPASETPTPVPDDIAAQSGKHPAQPTELKPADAQPTETKPVVKQPEPEGPNYIIYLVIVVIVGGIIAAVLLNR